MIEVWWARPEQATPAHLDLLDPVERAKVGRFGRQRDRDRSSVAAALLRLVVARHTGQSPADVTVTRDCPDCPLPHGRPRLAVPGLAVSVSHAGDLVGVALSTAGDVGLDVEHTDRGADVAALSRRVLSPVEARRSPPPDAFYVYWTRKEAVLKATGDGLRVPLTDLTVSPADAAPELLAFAGRPELVGTTWLRDLARVDNHVASLALLAGHPAPIVERAADGLLAGGPRAAAESRTLPAEL